MSMEDYRRPKTTAAASPSFFSKKWNIVGMIVALFAFAISLGIALGFPLGVFISTKPYRQQQQMQQMGTIYADEPAFNNNDEVDGYEFEGIGNCEDESGKIYDYIAFFVNSLQDCGQRCLACPGKGQADLVFLGFAYRKDKRCLCLVDNGATRGTLEDACAGYLSATAGWSGKGEIQGTNDDEDYQCWKSKGGKSKSSKRRKSKSSKGGNLDRKLVATENK